MKFLFFTLLVLTAAAAAVDHPKGFMGIPWGASPEEAKRALQARPGVKFPEDSDDYRVEVTGGTFAGQQVAKWVLEFPERRFASASVTLKTEGNASSVFKEFRTQLISKYGSVATEKKLTSSGTRKTSTGAQSLGSIATWKFSPTMKEKSRIAISAELSGPGGNPASEESQLSVTIRYINESLAGSSTTNGAAAAKTAHAPVKKEDL